MFLSPIFVKFCSIFSCTLCFICVKVCVFIFLIYSYFVLLLFIDWLKHIFMEKFDLSGLFIIKSISPGFRTFIELLLLVKLLSW